MDVSIIKKRLTDLVLSKSQNDEKLIHLDEQAKVLRKKLQLDSD